MKNIVKLESGKDLNLTSKSSREVVLSHHALSGVDLETKNGEIVGINVDGYDLKTGDVIKIKLFSSEIMPFKVKHIIRLSDNQYSLLATKLTSCTRWIMPMLRDKQQTYTSMKYKTHLVNCYVGTEGEGYMSNIYLVYRFSGSMEYRIFEEELKKHNLFTKVVDLDRHHVMYVFEMTEKQIKIFNLFKEGKYSMFPENYKKKIINFVINPADAPTEADRKATITYGTLYRTELQRDKIRALIGHSATLPKDAEYFSSPDEENEVYTGDIEIPSESLKV